MILNTEQLTDKILKSEKTRMHLYEGAVTGITPDMNRFENLYADEPKELIELVGKFSTMYPDALFTCFLITKGQSTEKGALFFQFKTPRPQADTMQAHAEPQPLLQGLKSEQEIRAEIFKEIEGKRKIEILVEENKNLRIEIKEKDSISGKFNGAIENIIMKFMQPPANTVNGALNGTYEETAAPQINDLENAFAILLKEFGEQDIIKLAQKLTGQNNDMLKSILINYINS